MPYRASDFYICPDCKRKGITVKFKPNGEDNYACRYCPFFVFIHSNFHEDKANMNKLITANPGRGL